MSGEAVFTLYDTYGFPWDLTEVIAGERGIRIDKEGYEEELKVARAKSTFKARATRRSRPLFKAARAAISGPTKFTGYEGRGTGG